ncbi:hypothetical protein Tco_0620179 [Tanacetum coccineum]
MAQLKYCDKHNQVGFLRKPDESAGFAEIVDFLRGSNLRYALITNPTIHDSLVKQFWQTATATTLADGTLELKATIDTIEYTITEASIRSKLQLADASGITMLPNNEIFEGMGHMGYPTDGSFTFWKSFFTPQWRFLVHHILHCISSKSGGWDQFGSNIATALICLSTGRVYNFSKLIFDGMVANLKSKTKFLMYPRFLQMILDIQTENKHPYLAVTLTKKIFGNMKRGFRGVPRPLLPAMLSIANPSAGQEAPSVTQPQPSSSVVPPTPPTTQPIPSEATTIPPLSQPAPPTPIAETTTASPSPTPSPAHEPMEHTFEQPSTDQQPSTPSQEATTSQLMARIDDLEKQLKETKQTFGKAILTLSTLFELGVCRCLYAIRVYEMKREQHLVEVLCTNTTNGYQSTMSNRHKDWLVQEQTALGKDFSNPLMADNLPKIIWLSTHHICAFRLIEYGVSNFPIQYSIFFSTDLYGLFSSVEYGCMTRSSTKELFTPFESTEQEFCSSRKLFKTLSLDESRSRVFDLFSDLEENFEEKVAETMAKTMEEYMSKTRANYGSGVTRPKIDDKNHFELKDQFLKELREHLQQFGS